MAGARSHPHPQRNAVASAVVRTGRSTSRAPTATAARRRVLADAGGPGRAGGGDGGRTRRREGDTVRWGVLGGRAAAGGGARGPRPAAHADRLAVGRSQVPVLSSTVEQI